MFCPDSFELTYRSQKVTSRKKNRETKQILDRKDAYQVSAAQATLVFVLTMKKIKVTMAHAER
jgi:hypothetical protein